MGRCLRLQRFLCSEHPLQSAENLSVDFPKKSHTRVHSKKDISEKVHILPPRLPTAKACPPSLEDWIPLFTFCSSSHYSFIFRPTLYILRKFLY